MSSLLKQVWSKTKQVTTFSRLTATFLVFNLILCLAQGAIQSFLSSINSNYSNVASAITREAQIPRNDFAWLTQHHNNVTLRICDHIPWDQTQTPCETVFQTGQQNKADLSSNLRRAIKVLEGIPSHPDFGAPLPVPIDPAHTLVRASANGTVEISHDAWKTVNHLDRQCTRVFVYVKGVLNLAKRENLAFLIIQIWLLVIAFNAVASKSIPRILTVICVRAVMSGWSAFEIWQTLSFKKLFEQMVSNPGSPCSVDIYPAYFNTRLACEISDLILNAGGLGLTIYFGIGIIKTFEKESFICLSPPKEIVRIYKTFTATQVCIQLDLFFLILSSGLWIDQLVNNPIGKHSPLAPGLLASFISITVLSLPWAAMGWFALKLEKRKSMVVFLATASILICSWASIFSSRVYRWIFVHWPLLASLTILTLVVLTATVGFGIISRLNFGEGLSQYLYVEERLNSPEREFKLPSHSPRSDQFDSSRISKIFQVPLPVKR